MRVLLLDLGNTRLKFAQVDAVDAHAPLQKGGGIAHDDSDFAARLRIALAELPPSRQALLASVAAPPLRLRVLEVLAAAGIAVETVAVEPQRPDLRIGYRQPERFGVDRWLALLGARRASEPGTALLVASCGTALTVDLVDATGRHHGGLIAASPTLMADALRARAAHLPAMADPAADEASAGFACDTASALHLGCHGAAAALLERSLRRGTTLLGVPPRLLLTGGGAPALLPVLTAEGVQASYHPALVLEGLARLARERAG